MLPAGAIRLAGPAFLVFACGFVAPLKLNLVGEIYASELLLPLAALVARFARGGETALRERLFSTLFLAALLTLAGYVVSDMAQGTRPDQYLRGWGRIGLIVSDFVALAIIFAQDRRNLWWYALGTGVGAVLFLRLVSHAPLAMWKFGYADPVLAASAALAVFLPWRLAAAWIGLLGLYSMWTDFRSFAAICLAIAGYLWIRAARPDRALGGTAGVTRLVVVGAAMLAVVLTTLALTGGSGTGRRSESDAGRRAAFETGIEAVRRKPLVGYGSWAESRELSAMYLARISELRGIRGGAASGRGTAFNPHSQILHAWFEGGILGTAFLVTILWQMLRRGGWLFIQRPLDALTPLLLYFALSTLWNLFMSPFTAPHRLGIAAGAAILVLMAIEQRAAASRVAPSPQPLPGAPPGSGQGTAAAGRRRVHYARRQLVPARPAAR